eukprot:164898_1
MREVKEDDLEILQTLEKAEILTNKLKTAEFLTDKDSVAAKCESHLTHCKNIISRVEIETRDMQTEDRSKVRQLLKERATKLKELKSELKWSKNNTTNINNNSDGINSKEADSFDRMNDDQIIDYARRIQNEDIQILDRVIIDVDQTKRQAEDVAQAVSNQTGQIAQIGRKLDDIDNELERAKRILIIMTRRIMTDKIIWVVVGLILVAVVMIVLQKTDVI